jgi:hypothetical protein
MVDCAKAACPFTVYSYFTDLLGLQRAFEMAPIPEFRCDLAKDAWPEKLLNV